MKDNCFYLKYLGAAIALFFLSNLLGQVVEAQELETSFSLDNGADYIETLNEDERMVIPPLFEYVVAPDELPDLRSRTDYLMDNFWSPFDFKNTKYVDQNALNHDFLLLVLLLIQAACIRQHILPPLLLVFLDAAGFAKNQSMI